MSKSILDQVKTEHLYIAVGRMHGDDDDTMQTIEAKDHADSCRIFERHLQECGGDFESEIYINEVLSLEDAIKARLSDSDINQHLDQDDLPNASVVYELQPNPTALRMALHK